MKERRRKKKKKKRRNPEQTEVKERRRRRKKKKKEPNTQEERKKKSLKWSKIAVGTVCGSPFMSLITILSLSYKLWKLKTAKMCFQFP